MLRIDGGGMRRAQPGEQSDWPSRQIGWLLHSVLIGRPSTGRVTWQVGLFNGWQG